jgi:hypothetical protein
MAQSSGLYLGFAIKRNLLHPRTALEIAIALQNDLE